MTLSISTLFKSVLIAAIILIAGRQSPSAFAQTINIRAGDIDRPLVLTLDKTNGEFASTDNTLVAFKSILEKSSKSRIQVQVFPNSQLGNEREQFEMVRGGSLQAAQTISSRIVAWVPEFQGLEIPYLFRDMAVALEVVNGPLGKELNDLVLKKTGVRVLGWSLNGPHSIIATKKEVRVPSDLKGLKIRTRGPVETVIVQLMGAAATPVPFPEVYTSLTQGIVDGMVTGLPFVRSLRAEKILKNMVLAEYDVGFSNMVMNERFFQSLSAHDKYLVQLAARAADKAHDGLVIWGSTQYAGHYREQGVNVYVPSPEELKQWVNVLRPPMVKWAKEQIGEAWVEKFIKATEEAERKLYGL